MLRVLTGDSQFDYTCGRVGKHPWRVDFTRLTVSCTSVLRHALSCQPPVFTCWLLLATLSLTIPVVLCAETPLARGFYASYCQVLERFTPCSVLSTPSGRGFLCQTFLLRSPPGLCLLSCPRYSTIIYPLPSTHLNVLIYVVELQSFFWPAIQMIDPGPPLQSFRASSGL